MLGTILRNVPYVGSAYGFAKTCNKVYNTTSPVDAVLTGVKSIVLDCTPPVIKYLVLCSALAACSVACITTGGNPFLILPSSYLLTNIMHQNKKLLIYCESV